MGKNQEIMGFQSHGKCIYEEKGLGRLNQEIRIGDQYQETSGEEPCKNRLKKVYGKQF